MFDLVSLKRRLSNRKPDLRIRLAQNADIFEIIALLKETKDSGELPIDLKKKGQDLLNIKHFYKEGIFLVAEEDGKIVALSSMLVDTNNVAHISKLMVSKYYRRLGLGTELIGMMKDHAKTKECTQIMISLPKAMKAGQKFIRYFGFQVLDAVVANGEKKEHLKYTLDFRH